MPAQRVAPQVNLTPSQRPTTAAAAPSRPEANGAAPAARQQQQAPAAPPPRPTNYAQAAGVCSQMVVFSWKKRSPEGKYFKAPGPHCARHID